MSAIGGKADIRCGRIAHEIDPRFERHKANDDPVLRHERLDVSFAIIVGFSEGVFCLLGREQTARLSKCDPARLIRWQCR